MQLLRRYLRPGDLCADIGANVGIYSLLIARHAGPVNVHAFECLPSNIPSCAPTCGSMAALEPMASRSTAWPWPSAMA